MSEPLESLGLTTVIENLRTIANVFRDDGKYVIASALYRRAITFLEGIHPYDARHALLAKILDDQSCLARKMNCGHLTSVDGPTPIMFLQTMVEPEA